MDLKLELVVIPVTNVDRAKDFYVRNAGFNLDVDMSFGDDFRVVQLTPPGSACSIGIGKGITEATPGSGPGPVLDRLRHTCLSRRARRARSCSRRSPASRVPRVGAGPGSRAGQLRFVRRLQGPRRQRLRPAGGRTRGAGVITDRSANSGPCDLSWAGDLRLFFMDLEINDLGGQHE
jgi:catechol 2,3-dioxygenase-like lactoylglutathione lyase family enzyme